MIKSGDVIRIKPEWQDNGDDRFEWRAVSGVDHGVIDVTADLGMRINPIQTVRADMIVLVRFYVQHWLGDSKIAEYECRDQAAVDAIQAKIRAAYPQDAPEFRVRRAEFTVA